MSGLKDGKGQASREKEARTGRWPERLDYTVLSDEVGGRLGCVCRGKIWISF